jgi:hypothetical protein
MGYSRLLHHLYRFTAQAAVLLLVVSGYGPLLAYAWGSDQEDALTEQVFSLDELAITDGYTKREFLVHGPEQAPPIDVVQRPTAPQETAIQAQDVLSISAGSVITVVSSRGVHSDPTLSADGRRVAFWSTANLGDKRPSLNPILINEIYIEFWGCYAPNQCDIGVLLEFYNSSTEDIDMSGWRYIGCARRRRILDVVSFLCRPAPSPLSGSCVSCPGHFTRRLCSLGRNEDPSTHRYLVLWLQLARDRPLHGWGTGAQLGKHGYGLGRRLVRAGLDSRLPERWLS